jgi:hypothetical protein
MLSDETLPHGAWVTKKELAAHLKMTTRWIEQQQRCGMPFLPCGMANRYTVAEVEAWIRERYRDRRRDPEVDSGQPHPANTDERA